MIKDITIGQYISGNSYIHKADPRVKIILSIFLMIIIIQIDTYIEFLAAIIFVTSAIIFSKLSLKNILKRIKSIIFISMIPFVINSLTLKGTTIIKFSIFNITYEGIDTLCKLTMRLVLLIIVSAILIITTTPLLLTDAIERLLSPLNKIKVPVHEIAMMMSIALKFIPILMEEANKIIKAQVSRGAQLESGNIMIRAKNFTTILIPLFISSFKRADDLAIAMESRCYRGGLGRTRMRELKLTAIDFWILIVTILYFVIVFYILHTVTKFFFMIAYAVYL